MAFAIAIGLSTAGAGMQAGATEREQSINMTLRDNVRRTFESDNLAESLVRLEIVPSATSR